MIALKLAIGFLLLISGFLFYYAPDIVYRINRIAREYIFSDRIVLLYHKKIAMLFISVSFVALYMGFSSQPYSYKKETKTDPVAAAKLEATTLYAESNFRASLRKTYWILSKNPKDKWALVHIACVYEALDEREKAIELWKKILSIYPDSKLAKKQIEAFELNAKNRRKN